MQYGSPNTPTSVRKTEERGGVVGKSRLNHWKSESVPKLRKPTKRPSSPMQSNQQRSLGPPLRESQANLRDRIRYGKGKDVNNRTSNPRSQQQSPSSSRKKLLPTPPAGVTREEYARFNSISRAMALLRREKSGFFVQIHQNQKEGERHSNPPTSGTTQKNETKEFYSPLTSPFLQRPVVIPSPPRQLPPTTVTMSPPTQPTVVIAQSTLMPIPVGRGNTVDTAVTPVAPYGLTGRESPEVHLKEERMPSGNESQRQNVPQSVPLNTSSNDRRFPSVRSFQTLRTLPSQPLPFHSNAIHWRVPSSQSISPPPPQNMNTRLPAQTGSVSANSPVRLLQGPPVVSNFAPAKPYATAHMPPEPLQPLAGPPRQVAAQLASPPLKASSSSTLPPSRKQSSATPAAPTQSVPKTHTSPTPPVFTFSPAHVHGPRGPFAHPPSTVFLPGQPVGGPAGVPSPPADAKPTPVPATAFFGRFPPTLQPADKRVGSLPTGTMLQGGNQPVPTRFSSVMPQSAPLIPGPPTVTVTASKTGSDPQVAKGSPPPLVSNQTAVLRPSVGRSQMIGLPTGTATGPMEPGRNWPTPRLMQSHAWPAGTTTAGMPQGAPPSVPHATLLHLPTTSFAFAKLPNTASPPQGTNPPFTFPAATEGGLSRPLHFPPHAQPPLTTASPWKPPVSTSTLPQPSSHFPLAGPPHPVFSPPQRLAGGGKSTSSPPAPMSPLQPGPSFLVANAELPPPQPTHPTINPPWSHRKQRPNAPMQQPQQSTNPTPPTWLPPGHEPRSTLPPPQFQSPTRLLSFPPFQIPNRIHPRPFGTVPYMPHQTTSPHNLTALYSGIPPTSVVPLPAQPTTKKTTPMRPIPVQSFSQLQTARTERGTLEFGGNVGGTAGVIRAGGGEPLVGTATPTPAHFPATTVVMSPPGVSQILTRPPTQSIPILSGYDTAFVPPTRTVIRTTAVSAAQAEKRGQSDASEEVHTETLDVMKAEPPVHAEAEEGGGASGRVDAPKEEPGAVSAGQNSAKASAGQTSSAKEEEPEREDVRAEAGGGESSEEASKTDARLPKTPEGASERTPKGKTSRGTSPLSGTTPSKQVNKTGRSATTPKKGTSKAAGFGKAVSPGNRKAGPKAKAKSKPAESGVAPPGAADPSTLAFSFSPNGAPYIAGDGGDVSVQYPVGASQSLQASEKPADEGAEREEGPSGQVQREDQATSSIQSPEFGAVGGGAPLQPGFQVDAPFSTGQSSLPFPAVLKGRWEVSGGRAGTFELALPSLDAIYAAALAPPSGPVTPPHAVAAGLATKAESGRADQPSGGGMVSMDIRVGHVRTDDPVHPPFFAFDSGKMFGEKMVESNREAILQCAQTTADEAFTAAVQTQETEMGGVEENLDAPIDHPDFVTPAPLRGRERKSTDHAQAGKGGGIKDKDSRGISASRSGRRSASRQRRSPVSSPSLRQLNFSPLRLNSRGFDVSFNGHFVPPSIAPRGPTNPSRTPSASRRRRRVSDVRVEREENPLSSNRESRCRPQSGGGRNKSAERERETAREEKDHLEILTSRLSEAALQAMREKTIPLIVDAPAGCVSCTDRWMPSSRAGTGRTSEERGGEREGVTVPEEGRVRRRFDVEDLWIKPVQLSRERGSYGKVALDEEPLFLPIPEESANGGGNFKEGGEDGQKENQSRLTACELRRRIAAEALLLAEEAVRAQQENEEREQVDVVTTRSRERERERGLQSRGRTRGRGEN
uniref:Uncharacterized protein n=1 Tax=Chromera velia CCMP2878 TaxID=1169474 RepID=A0A0G4FLZ7_9ALVE|eukprot:Cvel_17671.t1-p1 / transcript=Cvel_17671.t1 / gene=Cvel_17671 / organism=Chromera_velia_CCMP2878 / gene_product=Leucine-rich repeat extensin-like protein 5, putative / transcript_product=Leucine-rich repeat extensin-like protein 5, putative / location=Cvel_scaffold1424:27850-33021(+) / protein_length=1724 / sequence_SO=supercontig / SO=protein_coding / is_pseudo=false